ncbi:MAG: RraA family protein [Alphaproteobacteria bacterium]
MIDTFTIEPMPQPIDAAILARLAKAEPATIGHYRHDGFMDPGIRALVPDRRIAGTAVTLAIPGPDSALLHHAMNLVRPGDVLVIDRCGDARHACIGGVLALVARLSGLAGVVVDGPVTDIGEIRAQGVPMWSRGLSPITTKLLALGGRLNVPVACGGVAVRPGDAILAAENGVLVLGAAEAAAIADVAIADQEDEVEFNAQLTRGAKLGELSGATAKIQAALARRKG